MTVDRYRLKVQIDEALRPYGASAVAWVTSFSHLVIRKYDHPYSADRSVIFEEYILDGQDWLRKRAEIERQLVAIEQGKITPEMLYQADIVALPHCAGKAMNYIDIPEATKAVYTVKAAWLNGQKG